MEIMKDSERLQRLLDMKSIRGSELARMLEIGRAQGIYDILNDKIKISRNMAEKIVTIFPDIRKSWLLAGEGDMTVDSSGESNVDVEALKQEIIELRAVVNFLRKENERLIALNIKEANKGA